MVQNIEIVRSARMATSTILLWQLQSMWAAVPMSQNPVVRPAGSGRGRITLS
jgi:hypothetical protein